MASPSFFQKLISDLRASRKSQTTEDPMDKYFTEPVGMIFARLFMKLHWTPNMVTILSGIIGLVGGFFFYPKNFWLNLIGVLLEVFATILDATDGQMARIMHKQSRLGRVLDGVASGVADVCMYLALGFRMMTDNIPFTDTPWGFWIWPLLAVTGLIFHVRQDQMADYFRNLHLFFEKSQHGHEFERSSEVREKANKATRFMEKFYLKGYLGYTLCQEKSTPKVQALMEKIDENNGEYSEELRTDFLGMSSKYILLTNLLTINLRAYTMYILVLVGLPIFYCPFEILVLGAMQLFMVNRYEMIAQTLKKKYYPEAGGDMNS